MERTLCPGVGAITVLFGYLRGEHLKIRLTVGSYVLFPIIYTSEYSISLKKNILSAYMLEGWEE